MSKAFTKDDVPDEPLVLPSRPALPPGVQNYVTPRGLAALRAELHRLAEARRSKVEGEGEPAGDRSRAAAEFHARTREVEERIASAIVVEPGVLPRSEVRFGARVTVRGEAGSERCYEIVGIDEADGDTGRVAFLAPVARALLGKQVGDVVTLRTPRGEEELEVRAIE